MNNDSGENGLLHNVLAWFAHPFNSQGSAINWLFFVGLLFIAAWFWHIAFLTLSDEIG